MTSPKSSAATNTATNPHLATGGGITLPAISSSSSATTLRSSWIRRLLPPPPAASSSSSPAASAQKHATSTNNFRRLQPQPQPQPRPLPSPNTSSEYSDFVVRHYFNHSSRPPPPPPVETHLVAAFGPFQVRTRRSGREDHNKRGGLRLLPSFQFQPGGGRVSSRAGPVAEGSEVFTSNIGPGPTSSSNCWFTRPPAHDQSKRVTHLSPELVDESTSQRPYRRRYTEDLWPAAAWRSRGATYNDGISEPSTSERFPDTLALHHCKIRSHPVGQTPNCVNETETFSYWNMGRIKRTNTVSSVSPATALGKDVGRKRNSGADGLFSSKLRKLGTED